MTGLVAAYDPGGSVPAGAVSALLDTIDYRGHDGRDLDVRGPVGIGHQHFWTTPEALGQRQPLTLDDVTVAFDGRIDDREGLLAALPERRRPDDAPDARLVAEAYREWGPAAFERLVGVFAAIIWDGRDERLVCARGPAGLRELYYSTAGRWIAVGSDPGTVLSAPGVPEDIDEGLLGERLLGDHSTSDRTVYAAVRTVEPGTYVSFDGTGPSITRFWDPSTIDRLSTTDPDALADELADLLREAIAARLRTRADPYVLLSGGLDSTTITALAIDRVPGGDAIQALSMQYEDPDRADYPECHRAERRRVEAFAETYDLPVEYYPLDEAAAPLEVDAYDEPRLERGVVVGIDALKHEVYGQIAGNGCRVVLTGEFGNLFDGTRFAYHDLFREGRIRRAVGDLLADPLPIRELLQWYVLTPAFPRLGEWLLQRRNGGNGEQVPEWMSVEFAERIDLREQLSGRSDEVGFDRVAMQYTFDEAYRSDQLLYFGRDRRRALAAGVDTRHPFADRRVLEFLYALPTGTRIRAGETKFFFGRLAEELLPPAVRDQTHQFRFDSVVNRGMRGNPEILRSLLVEGELATRGIVDRDEIERIVTEYLDGSDRHQMRLWQLVGIELWFRDR